MGKIDLDKFIASICRSPISTASRITLIAALKEQGLLFVGDDIIEERPNPKWYKCTKDYRGFIEGKLYCTNENGDLPSETGGKYVLAISNPFFKEWFRPATEEEIKEISGNDGGISPNCELTEFEETLKIIVNGFGGDVMTDVGAKNAGARLLDLARKEILKDLPKWRKSVADIAQNVDACIIYENRAGVDFSRSVPVLKCGIMQVDIEDLKKKLPKEE